MAPAVSLSFLSNSLGKVLKKKAHLILGIRLKVPSSLNGIALYLVMEGGGEGVENLPFPHKTKKNSLDRVKAKPISQT